MSSHASRRLPPPRLDARPRAEPAAPEAPKPEAPAPEPSTGDLFEHFGLEQVRRDPGPIVAAAPCSACGWLVAAPERDCLVCGEPALDSPDSPDSTRSS